MTTDRGGPDPAAGDPVLARRLGTGDAVLVGVGAMLGAGVFAVFAPATAAAGHGLLVALGVAAVVAYCNALSSAQLAAQYPASGGTYVCGREQLGPWWGFAAGWSFVIGKTASCAAMALTFAAYAVPGPPWLSRTVAVAATLTLAGVNLRGITRTAAVNRVLVAATVLALGLVVTAIAVAGQPHLGALAREGARPDSLHGLLQGGPQVPRNAELAVAAAVTCLVLSFDVRAVIAFSSFGVLLYYAVANVSAFRQSPAYRRWPRAVNALGLLGCVVLVAALPASTLAAGIGVLLAGLAGRLATTGLRDKPGA